MVKWSEFTPTDFEYDFERDKLGRHRVTFDEAVECFPLGAETLFSSLRDGQYEKQTKETDRG